jgi:threonine aldolase
VTAEDPTPTLEEQLRTALRACDSTLIGNALRTPAQRLAALAAVHVEDDGADFYGRAGVLAELEAEIAELLGKPAAVFMPSGVMAQQCALRVWADRRASRRVAVHAMSHLVVHELSALESLHGLQVEHLTTEPRPSMVEDLAALPGRLGAVSIELPLRDAGHLLPSWKALVALADACRAREIPLHLDGARLWESTPYWDKSLADVAALADSVYVSFYKSLGGLAGAALAGPEDVIDEARRWQRRHGGTLVTLLPYVISAREGLRRHLPEMKRYHDVAVEIAAGLVDRGLMVEPEPPHTNAFVIYAPAPADAVRQRLLEHAQATREVVLRGAQPTEVPGWSKSEFAVGSATCGLPPADVAARLAAVLLGDRSGT